MDLTQQLLSARVLKVRQRKELVELLGFEGRNKYEINNEKQVLVGFAAEKSKGFWDALVRNLLGHWRTFEIAIFDPQRQQMWSLHNPFRFFMRRIEVSSKDTKIGAVQQRFSMLRRRFDIENARGQVVFEMSTAFWKPWTFPILRKGTQVALIKKEWSGLLKEALTDADNFSISFTTHDLTLEDRSLILSAALFIDLCYFEQKPT